MECFIFASTSVSLDIRRPAESMVGVACECVTGGELLYLFAGETRIWSWWGLLANKY